MKTIEQSRMDNPKTQATLGTRHRQHWAQGTERRQTNEESTTQKNEKDGQHELHQNNPVAREGYTVPVYGSNKTRAYSSLLLTKQQSNLITNDITRLCNNCYRWKKSYTKDLHSLIIYIPGGKHVKSTVI